MQHSSSLSNSCTSPDAGKPGSATRKLAACGTILLGPLLCTLMHVTGALAGDQAPLPGAAAKSAFDDFRQAAPLSPMIFQIPAPYQATNPSDAKTFSSQEFRPRAHSNLGPDAGVFEGTDDSMMNRTTVWERLSETRSLNRVRVVTLLESGGSSLSLQAGRKGDPSLQWTSRFLNHGDAPRGLLDELFSTSFGTSTRGLHLGPHPSYADSSIKTTKPFDAAAGGISK